MKNSKSSVTNSSRVVKPRSNATRKVGSRVRPKTKTTSVVKKTAKTIAQHAVVQLITDHKKPVLQLGLILIKKVLRIATIGIFATGKALGFIFSNRL
jgi:hypothetical protein